MAQRSPGSGGKQGKKKLGLGFAMRVATEHLSYRSLIEEIERDVERVRSAESGSSEELLRLLESFQSQVRAHFALEECGGLFDVYQEHGDSFRREAALLLGQHADFRARLGRVLELARGLPGLSGPELEGLARELGELFRGLRAHEQAEDALLERLVDLDIRRER